METIDNDSPRQPVWQAWVQPRNQVINTTTDRDDHDDHRRCICGARPTPAGTLPCDH